MSSAAPIETPSITMALDDAIPPGAVDSAARAIYRTSGRNRVMPYSEASEDCESDAREILEAAAPHMLVELQKQDEALARVESLCSGWGKSRGLSIRQSQMIIATRSDAELGTTKVIPTEAVERERYVADLSRAQTIAADVHRDLPDDTDPAIAFAEFKRRLGPAK